MYISICVCVLFNAVDEGARPPKDARLPPAYSHFNLAAL